MRSSWSSPGSLLSGNLAISPSYNKKLGYDAQKDFAPITAAAAAGQILVVHPMLPVKSVKDLILKAARRS